MFDTWGRSVRASNPKNVMVRTVVTPEILFRYYVKTSIFYLLIFFYHKLKIQPRFFSIKISISKSYGRAYLHYNLKPCNVSPNSL